MPVSVPVPVPVPGFLIFHGGHGHEWPLPTLQKPFRTRTIPVGMTAYE